LETAAALAVRAELREHRGAGIVIDRARPRVRLFRHGALVFISNRCIRLRNRDVRRLDRLMSVGTPILIR
jgi:hypothetical protein